MNAIVSYLLQYSKALRTFSLSSLNIYTAMRLLTFVVQYTKLTISLDRGRTFKIKIARNFYVVNPIDCIDRPIKHVM